MTASSFKPSSSELVTFTFLEIERSTDKEKKADQEFGLPSYRITSQLMPSIGLEDHSIAINYKLACQF